MKNFTFKLLQQLNKKKADKGFTLIELLVVIIIIGILSAIALPSFLNQANKARQSEAKQSLGAINRGQQGYYLERQLFSNNINGLGLGVQIDTENYSYGSANDDNSSGSGSEGLTTGEAPDTVNGFPGYDKFTVTFGVSGNQQAVRDYFGAVYVIPATAQEEATTAAVLCEEAQLLNGTATQLVSFSNTALNGITDPNTVVNCAADGSGNDVVIGTNSQNVGQ